MVPSLPSSQTWAPRLRCPTRGPTRVSLTPPPMGRGGRLCSGTGPLDRPTPPDRPSPALTRRGPHDWIATGLIFLMLVVLVVPSISAEARSTSLSVSPGKGSDRRDVLATVAGLPQRAQVALYWDRSTTPIATGSDPVGRDAELTFAIPATSPGPHAIRAVATTVRTRSVSVPRPVAETSFTVTTLAAAAPPPSVGATPQPTAEPTPSPTPRPRRHPRRPRYRRQRRRLPRLRRRHPPRSFPVADQRCRRGPSGRIPLTAVP